MTDISKRRKQLTVKQIAEALRKTGGFITQSARLLGVSHSNISQRIKRSETLQKVRKEVEEKALDMAESELLKHIKQSNFKAIRFYLKTKGRSRGYTEKQDINIGGQEANPVIFEVEYIFPEGKNTAARQNDSIFKPPQKV